MAEISNSTLIAGVIIVVLLYILYHLTCLPYRSRWMTRHMMQTNRHYKNSRSLYDSFIAKKKEFDIFGTDIDFFLHLQKCADMESVLYQAFAQIDYPEIDAILDDEIISIREGKFVFAFGNRSEYHQVIVHYDLKDLFYATSIELVYQEEAIPWFAFKKKLACKYFNPPFKIRGAKHDPIPLPFMPLGIT